MALFKQHKFKHNNKAQATAISFMRIVSLVIILAGISTLFMSSFVVIVSAAVSQPGTESGSLSGPIGNEAGQQNTPVHTSIQTHRLLAKLKNREFTFVIGKYASVKDSEAALYAKNALGIKGKIMKYDSDITDYTAGNFVFVSGSCAAAVKQGGSFCGTAPVGEGVINIFNDNGYYQIIVAGASADDTRRAMRSLVRFSDAEFDDILASGGKKRVCGKGLEHKPCEPGPEISPQPTSVQTCSNGMPPGKCKAKEFCQENLKIKKCSEVRKCTYCEEDRNVLVSCEVLHPGCEDYAGCVDIPPPPNIYVPCPELQ